MWPHQSSTRDKGSQNGLRAAAQGLARSAPRGGSSLGFTTRSLSTKFRRWPWVPVEVEPAGLDPGSLGTDDPVTDDAAADAVSIASIRAVFLSIVSSLRFSEFVSRVIERAEKARSN